jgi:hypothetical protein
MPGLVVKIRMMDKAFLVQAIHYLPIVPLPSSRTMMDLQ